MNVLSDTASVHDKAQRAQEAWQSRPTFHAPKTEDPVRAAASKDNASRKRTSRRPGALTRLLTTTSLAKLLQVSEAWIRGEVEAGRIPHLLLEDEVRFDRRSINRWVAM